MGNEEVRLVLDASVVLSWCFDDEEGEYGKEVFDLQTRGQAVVPPLWLLEVTNALAVAERRGRLRAAEGDAFMRQLLKLGIEVDDGDAQANALSALALARAHGLSVYDAAYLELALREHIPLATTDRALLKAMQLTGVPRASAGHSWPSTVHEAKSRY